MTLTHVNPAQLHTSPAFSQGVIAEAGRTLYVGGQNGTDGTGAISGGIAEQTAQAFRNVLAVLEAPARGLNTSPSSTSSSTSTPTSAPASQHPESPGAINLPQLPSCASPDWHVPTHSSRSMQSPSSREPGRGVVDLRIVQS